MLKKKTYFYQWFIFMNYACKQEKYAKNSCELVLSLLKTCYYKWNKKAGNSSWLPEMWYKCKQKPVGLSISKISMATTFIPGIAQIQIV